MSFLDKATPVIASSSTTPSFLKKAVPFIKQEEQPGIIKGIAQDITKTLITQPVVRTAQLATTVAEPFLSPENQEKARKFSTSEQSIKYPLIGKVTVPAPGETMGETIREVVSQGAKTAAALLPYGKVAGAVEKVLPSVIPKIVPKTISGATGGYSADLGYGLEDKNKTIKEAVTPGVGTVIGTALPFIPLAKKFTPSKEKAINSLEQDYENWMSGTTVGKKKIAKIETKTTTQNIAGTTGKTPMRTLAEQGIIPNRTGTKLDTFDQAQQYRQNITPLREANREALKEVGLSSSLVKLDDLEQASIKQASTQRNIDAGRAPKMVKEIQNEFNLLREAYPDGHIPLEKVDEIKSARWDNVFGNKGLVDADVLKKDSEYAIAKALQKEIEDVAEVSGNPHVAQLNREIGDRLDAAKFLEDLNGKTIKGGRLLKYVTTGVGSAMGETIPGKIFGALGGNIVGEIIIASNVATPIKRIMLRNLETKDPVAFTKTVEWLRKQNIDRETRLLLPAPKYIPMGGKDIKGNIVSPSGKKTTPKIPKINVTEAKKNPISVNPKTGKFQTSYSSQSKSPINTQTTKAINNDITIKNSIPLKKKVISTTSIIGGISAASAQTNKNPEEVKTINTSLDSVYMNAEKIAPMIHKDYIKTLVQRESSGGVDDTHRDADAGKYGWVVGFTKPTLQDIKTKAKVSQKYKNLIESLPGFDTPEDAIKSALIYSNFLMRDHTKEQTTGKREYKKINATQLYKLYNGGGSPAGVKAFDKEFSAISSKKKYD